MGRVVAVRFAVLSTMKPDSGPQSTVIRVPAEGAGRARVTPTKVIWH